MERLLQLMPLEWRLHSVGEFADASGWHCTIAYRLTPVLSVQGFGETPLEALKAAVQSATIRHPRHVMFRRDEPQLPGSENYRGRPAWDNRASLHYFHKADAE